MNKAKAHTLLIANRGEIAVRIIRAANLLGMRTVLACSEADAESLPARLADQIRIIGPARADKSYLNGAAIIAAALDSGASAIHPGYGFLSENPAFARDVAAAGLIFVGPDADTIATMGDKAAARRTAQAAGVPVVPGSAGEIDDLDAAIACAAFVGYPLLIKAAAGGGGRGIRLAQDEAQLRQEFALAQTEARAAFGSGAVYLERFIRGARHIEVQILGDGQHAVHLFERECSLQRRRQKVLEEAPSPSLNASQRAALCDSAVKLARHIGYKGAGTLEYLFDSQSGEFFFIEMNTRIQVEHPVTEMITGVDLVQWMLRIACGEPLTLPQSDIPLHGHAIEMRLNAEDPSRQFAPSPGTVNHLRWPHGLGVRVDSHLFNGYRMPPYYDSLLAKLIVHAPDRHSAIRRARQAIADTLIDGLYTTLPLHAALLAAPFFTAAEFDTGTLENWLASAPLAAMPLQKEA